MVDWDNVPKNQIADVCRRDPMMWAEAFCHTAKKIGVDLGDDPEGWMVGWFSAAMQAETDHMTPEQHEHEAREQRRVNALSMTDTVERLRRQVSELPYDGFVSPLEAADEIDRLRADNARLKAALLDIANMPTTHDGERIFGDIARSALEGKDG